MPTSDPASCKIIVTLFVAYNATHGGRWESWGKTGGYGIHLHDFSIQFWVIQSSNGRYYDNHCASVGSLKNWQKKYMDNPGPPSQL